MTTVDPIPNLILGGCGDANFCIYFPPEGSLQLLVVYSSTCLGDLLDVSCTKSVLCFFHSKWPPESLDSVNLAKSWCKIKRFKRFCDLSQSKGVKLMFLCVFYAKSAFSFPFDWHTSKEYVETWNHKWWVTPFGCKELAPDQNQNVHAKLKIAHVNIVWLTYLIHYTKLHILDTHKSWYILHYYTVRLHQYHILCMKKGNSRFLGQHNMHNLAATLRSCQLSGWPTTKAVRHNFHVPNFLKKEILPIKNYKIKARW